MSVRPPQVREIDPPYVVPEAAWRSAETVSSPSERMPIACFFGDHRAQVTRVSSDTIAAIVPEDALSEMSDVRVEIDGGSSTPHHVSVAHTIASNCNPWRTRCSIVKVVSTSR